MAHAPAFRRHHQGPQALGPQVDHRPAGGTAADGHQSGPSARFEVCADGRCPIEDTLNVIAGRWKILILWWLHAGELRFSELRRYIPSVTPKMLTQQLRQMEDEGLVHREVFAQVPPKVIYTLTERGQSLQPVLQSLYDWSVAQPAK